MHGILSACSAPSVHTYSVYTLHVLAYNSVAQRSTSTCCNKSFRSQSDQPNHCTKAWHEYKAQNTVYSKMSDILIESI